MSDSSDPIPDFLMREYTKAIRAALDGSKRVLAVVKKAEAQGYRLEAHLNLTVGIDKVPPRTTANRHATRREFDWEHLSSTDKKFMKALRISAEGVPDDSAQDTGNPRDTESH